jgi:hypothetical protein
VNLGRLLAEAERRGLVQGQTSDDWDRLVADVCDRIRGSLFTEQLALIDEERTWSVAVCGRQAGKNFTAVRLMLWTALLRPNAEVVYVNGTYAEARRIMWADELDGLPAVARSLGIPFTANETRLELTFRNGSKVVLLGADRGAWEKLRGSKLDLLVVDEMQKMEPEGLSRAFDQILPACFVARRGRFVGIGTPDEFCAGPLHDISAARLDPKFAVHHWDASCNTLNPVPWEGLLQWKAESLMADDDPRWLREGRGLWVRQDSVLMMPLDEGSLWDGTYPTEVRSKGGVLVPRSRPFEHYAGLDFGWTDAAALVVGSISREEGVLREVLSWKQSGLDTDALAAAIGPMLTQFNVRRIYADAARPDTIATLGSKYRLPIYAAEKHDKVTWIQDMRAKVRSGRFQVLRDSRLHGELMTLHPDPTKFRRGQLESPPGAEDHCWDASRYLYRGVFSEWVNSPEAPMTSEERQRSEVERIKREAMRPRNRR